MNSVRPMNKEDKLLPLSAEIVRLVLAKKPMHRKFLLRAISDLNETERAEVERYIAFQLQDGLTAERIASGYVTIDEDTFI